MSSLGCWAGPCSSESLLGIDSIITIIGWDGSEILSTEGTCIFGLEYEEEVLWPIDGCIWDRRGVSRDLSVPWWERITLRGFSVQMEQFRVLFSWVLLAYIIITWESCCLYQEIQQNGWEEE